MFFVRRLISVDILFLLLLYFTSLPLLTDFFFFLMIRRPPRSTLDRSSAASDVYKRQRRGDPGIAEGAGSRPRRPARTARRADDACAQADDCLLYTSPSPRDRTRSRMPSSA